MNLSDSINLTGVRKKSHLLYWGKMANNVSIVSVFNTYIHLNIQHYKVKF
jgi:hypothetical protein